MINGEYRQRLETVFTPPQAEVLADWMEAQQRSLIKAGDFNELKEIVRDLGEAQKRTAAKVEELAIAQKRTEARVGELAAAQKLTEIRLEELVTAQQRTENKLEELVTAQQRTEAKVEALAGTMQTLAQTQAEMQRVITQLGRGLDETRSLAGAGAQTLGYMLENEAYRHLPAWLKERHGIEVSGRMIREQVGDEEINLLVEARQGAEEVVIVGESKGRLHTSDVGLLADKVEEVRRNYQPLGKRRIVPLLVTHFAPEKVRRKAAEAGVIVVQSFEW